MTDANRRTTRSAWSGKYLVLAAILIAAFWVYTFRQIDEGRLRTLATTENDLVNLARLSQEHAESTFRSVDQTLRLTLREYLENKTTFDLRDMAEKGIFDAQIFHQVAIINAKGLVEQSTLPFDAPDDRSAREYFTVHLNPESTGLFISHPMFGRAADKWPVQLSRRITRQDGSFGGVIVASLDPAYFTGFYGELQLGAHGIASLFGMDGALRALRIDNRHEYVGDESANPVFARLAKGESTSMLTYPSPYDGIERIHHFRKLPSYPLVVGIGVATEDVFAEHLRTQVDLWEEAILVSVLLAALAIFATWNKAVRDRHYLQQRQSLSQLKTITRRVPGFVFQYLRRPDGSSCFPFASEGSQEIYRLRPEEVVEDSGRIQTLIHPDDVAGLNAAIDASEKALTPWSQEFRVRFDDGTVSWRSAMAMPEKQADGSVLWNGFVSDTTQRKQAEDEIRQLAFYDPLTSLPNRRLLVDRLHCAMAASSRSGREGAVLFLDLDNFKTLNDTQGHDKGDLLLQQVARRLTACVRKSDTVARLGGDEFVVILEDLSKSTCEAAIQTEAVGQKILFALNKPYDLGEQRFDNTSSIGVALFTDHRLNVEELMRHADMAMYQAKSAGRNTLRFYDPEMQGAVDARAALEVDLRAGLQQNQLLLHYQPQVDRYRVVTGVEALVRWQHPQRGLLLPAEFIPLAEETGLILALGHWVIETACAQLAVWANAAEAAHLTIAVNVSAKQFRQSHFVSQVLSALEASGANPRKLKLELTESLLLDDIEDVIGKMGILKEKGVCFSLDDFGTGYSSLAYLKRLPLDQLKIDRCFVRDLLTDANDSVIVRTIVALAQSLGLEVIAEGVETDAQCAFLAAVGCHAYQGYLFGRPGAVELLHGARQPSSRASPLP